LAKPILRSEKMVLLTEPQSVDFKNKAPVKDNEELSESENRLYSKLADLRSKLAEEEEIQALRIFSNATLINMARVKPGNLSAFSSISGVGEYKLEKYGDTFINTILDIVPKDECLLLETQDLKKTSKRKTKTKTDKKTQNSRNSFTLGKISKTHQQTFDMLSSGLSPEEIAEQRDVKVETIYSHMFRLALSGKEIDISTLIHEDDILIIQEKWLALDKPDSSKLMFHKLDEIYRYDQIEYAITKLCLQESVI
jgi:ATP-dependent DNA helicase RecQ